MNSNLPPSHLRVRASRRTPSLPHRILAPLCLVLALSGCAKCLIQGPNCNRNMMQQRLLDQSINENPSFLTPGQRRRACETLAEGVGPWIRSNVSTNQIYDGQRFVTVIETNCWTNTYMPGWYDLPDRLDIYGIHCTITWGK